MGNKRVFRADVEANIGAAIRAARIGAGITQVNLAAMLDVSYQQVQNYEKGSVRIPASRLKAIAGLLKTPIEEFFKDGLSNYRAVLDPGEGSTNDDH
jgi:transcriptional regulator with XRE-family HTH domain